VVLLGGGANRAAAEARQLVEALDAPTACTINAKGILPKGHPLSLGSNTSLRPVRELLLASDAVLAVGTEMGETDYDLVFDGNLRIECPLVRIDIDPEQVNSNFPADVAIVSDSKLAIESLLLQIDGRESASPDSPGAKLTADVRALLDAAWPAAWQGQRRTLEALQDALPDLIVVGDSTQPVYSGNHLFEPSTPRSWFNSATGYGTLGYGLPAAVGAKLAAPGRPVVALIGDGGLQFTLPELASAIEARAPIIVLLWNNEGYGEIKRYMQERGIPTIGVDIYTPDLLAIAKGFGCAAERATSFGQLRELLQRAARSDRPTVIEVREDAQFLALAR
jgi:acetolactate synthase-1/2/3 large subunit